MDDDALAVIVQAERVIYRTAWRLLEESALAGLAGTCGLRRAPLEPRSDVIQLVAFDGEHIGHIRCDRGAPVGEIWVAVSHRNGRPVGSYRSAGAAAEALACACGKLSPRIPRHREASGSRRLLLLRHAKSAWPREVPDQDRPLARRGRRDAPVAGRWLQQAGYVPDHVLCSTARRARETWQLAERELVVRPRIVYEPGVYDASASSLLSLVRRQPSAARTVLVVGHDPALPELALKLAAEADHPDAVAAEATSGAAIGRMQAKFPTAAIAVLETAALWSELGPGQAQLVNFVTPRIMDDGHLRGHGRKRSAEDGSSQ